MVLDVLSDEYDYYAAESTVIQQYYQEINRIFIFYIIAFLWCCLVCSHINPIISKTCHYCSLPKGFKPFIKEPSAKNIEKNKKLWKVFQHKIRKVGQIVRKAIRDGLLKQLHEGKLEEILREVTNEPLTLQTIIKEKKGNFGLSSTVLAITTQSAQQKLYIKKQSQKENYIDCNTDFVIDMPKKCSVNTYLKRKKAAIKAAFGHTNIPVSIEPEKKIITLSKTSTIKKGLSKQNNEINMSPLINSMKLDCYKILGNVLDNVNISLSLVIRPEELLSFCLFEDDEYII